MKEIASEKNYFEGMSDEEIVKEINKLISYQLKVGNQDQIKSAMEIYANAGAKFYFEKDIARYHLMERVYQLFRNRLVELKPDASKYPETLGELIK